MYELLREYNIYIYLFIAIGFPPGGSGQNCTKIRNRQLYTKEETQNKKQNEQNRKQTYKEYYKT
jgi:hypothetical protein